MALRAPIDIGQAAPIQIRAQVLRKRNDAASSGATLGYAIMPQDSAQEIANPKQIGRTNWRQSDVRRAIAAAEQAGLQCYRVEIAANGSIAIIVGDPLGTEDPASGEPLLIP